MPREPGNPNFTYTVRRVSRGSWTYDIEYPYNSKREIAVGENSSRADAERQAKKYIKELEQTEGHKYKTESSVSFIAAPMDSSMNVPLKTPPQVSVNDLVRKIKFAKSDVSSASHNNGTLFYAYLPPNTGKHVAEARIRTRDNILHNLMTRPNFRRYGIARRLLGLILSDPDTKSPLTLYAKALESQKGLPQKQLEMFYNGFGFHRTGKVHPVHGVEMVWQRPKVVSVTAKLAEYCIAASVTR